MKDQASPMPLGAEAEREAMKREISELRAALANVAAVLRRVPIEQTSASVLDEMLAALQAKQGPVVEVKIPGSLVRALSGAFDE